MAAKLNLSLLISIALILIGCSTIDVTPESRPVSTEEAPVDISQRITFMKDGGWCWYQDPRAIINNGQLLVAGLGGSNGDVKVSVFELGRQESLGTATLHEQFEIDDHDVPALYARPNGSILAVWAKHAKEKIHHYSISSTEDYTKWGPRQQFVHEYEDNRGVTYMNLYEMQDQGLLLNFYRDGETYNPSYITSDDYGLTWGNRTHFIADEVDGRNRPYPRYLQRDANTIGVSFTDAHPRNYGNSLYYADFRDGTFYNADGYMIRNLESGPLLTSEAEKVYTGSETIDKPEGFESVPNSAWTCAMAKDSNSCPHIGYTLYLSNDDHRFRIASWDGKKWIDREIAYAGKCLYQKESSYTGLMAFDPDDPRRVFISTDVDPSTGKDSGGVHEIHTAIVDESDDISSIKWTPVTSGSTHRNIRPVVASGEGYKVLLWLNGPWNTFKEYESDIVGIILQRPEDIMPRLENPLTTDYLKKHILKDHPRLVLTPDLEKQLRGKVLNDPVVSNMYAAVKMNAESIYGENLLVRQKTGRRLLSVSREMLWRMNMLGMVYRIEKDPKALRRINAELAAVCRFSDWNPSHFLDVAEMSLAVSLALDWTHGDLPESTVAMAKQALIDKAILPSWKMNNGRGRSYAENNWNQVCNGGLVAAAIAIAEEDPELAARTIYRALDGLPVALRHYGPDGAHHEGSTYWNYATVFTAMISSMLESAFGDDFGIYEYPGIADSATYRVMMTAPSGYYYNYGDCGLKRSDSGDITLAWFASKTGNRTHFEKDRFLNSPDSMGKLDRLAGAGLVWLSQYHENTVSEVPVNYFARGINPVVIFRNGENDPHEYYFGAKGGCGAVNHGNMDAGSFIFELNGVRWAIDVGNQDYNTIEQAGLNLWDSKQDGERWKLLSKNNYGHSTLTVNNACHNVDGFSQLINFKDGPNPTATFDMSPVFGEAITFAARTFTRDSATSITIQDKLQTTDMTGRIVWQMTTLADVETVPGGAILSQGDESLRLECLSHPDLEVSVISLFPPPIKLDSRIPGLKRLEIDIPVNPNAPDWIDFVVRLAGN